MGNSRNCLPDADRHGWDDQARQALAGKNTCVERQQGAPRQRCDAIEGWKGVEVWCTKMVTAAVAKRKRCCSEQTPKRAPSLAGLPACIASRDGGVGDTPIGAVHLTAPDIFQRGSVASIASSHD